MNKVSAKTRSDRQSSYHRALAACEPRVRGLGFSNTASNVKFTNLME